MHYWNRDNFEGLAELAVDLRSEPRLADLARYCDLREQGLRTEAFLALQQFLTSALSSDVEVQRALALRVVDAHARTPAAHQFLSHPLQHRFVEPVLSNWSEAEPNDATPVAALALLRRDQQLLGDALRMNPADDRVRACLVSILIGHVEFATHHLVEGKLIGTTEEATVTLDEAEQHIRTGADPAKLQDFAAEIAELRGLLSDWTAYQQNPTGTFPEWCRAHDRAHRWWSIVYFDP